METTTEHYRPRVHFAPAKHWMNDPNGLIHLDGTWHLFFQHNPNGSQWGDIAWGHATSRDLLTWTEQPIAIVGDEHEMIFSGSIVLDEANTSGFGQGSAPLVAIYTSHYLDHPVHGTRQAQSVAYSLDQGMNWTKYEGNPVDDRDRPDYRDPKVFWHEGANGGRWIMVAVEADRSRLIINGSHDLLHWVELSTFQTATVPGFWECPDLFPLTLDDDEERWVLYLSTGGPHQAYVVGEFDGERFVEEKLPPSDRRDRLAEYGHDNYAAVTFSGVDDRRIMMGWMGHAFDAPTNPWRGTASIPRELSLTTIAGVPRLVSRFVRELDRFDGAGITLHPSGDGQSIRLGDHAGLPMRIRCQLTPNTDGISVGTRIVSDSEELVVHVLDGQVILDRSRSSSGLPDDLDPLSVAPLKSPGATVHLDILLDAMSVEVIGGQGEILISETLFAGSPWHTVAPVDARSVRELRATIVN